MPKIKKEKQTYYLISAVADRFDVHPQTLRLYEREGLITPSRTEGNTRVYNEDDLERLDLILNLTREMGVNLAGVDVILNMKEKMESLQGEMLELLKYLRAEFERKYEGLERKVDNALIRVPPARRLKRTDRKSG
jgi:MerR family transcriptional regulator/heat shock protein HspR